MPGIDVTIETVCCICCIKIIVNIADILDDIRTVVDTVAHNTTRWLSAIVRTIEIEGTSRKEAEVI